jgi:hypothetical protein
MLPIEQTRRVGIITDQLSHPAQPSLASSQLIRHP